MIIPLSVATNGDMNALGTSPLAMATDGYLNQLVVRKYFSGYKRPKPKANYDGVVRDEDEVLELLSLIFSEVALV